MASRKNKITLISYCSLNYQACLDKFLPTWTADEIIIFTDSEDLILPDKVRKVVLQSGTSKDWHVNTERKIISVIGGLNLATNDNIMWIDCDCMMVKPVNDVFNTMDKDILATRMVYRRDKSGEREINSGVIFIKRNDRTIKMADEWLDLARKYIKIPDYATYHEQTAFSHLCYEAYDGLKYFTVGNISERIYNLENDDHSMLLKWISTYNPHIIHFKSRLWEDKDFYSKVKALLK